MNENKQSNTGKEEILEGAGGKLLYEKPKLTPVSLFADQVLAGCAKQYPNDFCELHGNDLSS
ncbi:MAG: hypothetical protein D3909_09225 [Candidatus Electrothrix sp. ATG1]|nr:hypothetical protein [Candidatus Electrothrix sp. ATG1]